MHKREAEVFDGVSTFRPIPIFGEIQFLSVSRSISHPFT